MAGFGALLQSSTALFTAAKVLGGTYLLWVGIKSVRGAVGSLAGPTEPNSRGTAIQAVKGVRRSLVDGYLTQMSNPKSTLFFLAMFTTVVPAETTFWQGASIIAVIGAVALAGYVLIAAVLSRPVFKRAYRRIGPAFDAVLGLAMTALGVRVLVADR